MSEHACKNCGTEEWFLGLVVEFKEMSLMLVLYRSNHDNCKNALEFANKNIEVADTHEKPISHRYIIDHACSSGMVPGAVFTSNRIDADPPSKMVH